MLSRRLQQQIGDVLVNQNFASVLTGTDVAVEVRIEQIAWHHSKAIVLGRVVGADDQLRVGASYLGTTAKVLNQRPELVEGIDLGETDWEYLTQPLDLENGQTSHEISWRLMKSIASAQ